MNWTVMEPRGAKPMGPAKAAPATSALEGMDERGRFQPSDVEALRRMLGGHPDSARPIDHPEDLFGPWEDLGVRVRETIRSLLHAELQAAMGWYPSGRVWPWLVNRLMAAASWASDRGARRLARALKGSGTRLYAAPFRLRQSSVHRWRARRWSRATRPGLFDMLAALDRRPQWLEGDWADGVVVPPRLRGAFRDRARNIVQGYLLGLDLIPTDDGVWCVEANLNTSFAPDVRRPFLDPEPAVDVVVREAVEMGAERIWWMEQLQAPTRTWLMEELGTKARAAGLDVRFLEDWRVPRGETRPLGTPPRAYYTDSGYDPPANTLILRRNSLPLGPDYIVADKEPFVRGLARTLRDRGESRVAVPEMTRRPGRLLDAGAPGLPNLVYKYPDLGKGEGVYFLRARDAAHAEALAREIDARTGEPPGLFQPFVLSRVLPGRRIYDVRCEIFLSPRGIRPVFALRRESTRPLPESVDPGIATGKGVFTSNVSQGGRFAPVPPDEASEVWAAAAAVGEALLSLLNRGYEIEVGAPGHD